MAKRNFQPVFLILFFLFSINCKDETESITGNCRLKRITYQGASNQSITFEYDHRGLLTGYNRLSGSTCRSDLYYNDALRLIRRVEQCSGKVNFEIVYNYISPHIVMGEYKNHYTGAERSTVIYYNADNQIDSAKIMSGTYRVKSTFTYLNNNLVSSIQTREKPCCEAFTISETNYDTGINPFSLLKQTSNDLGMESIVHLLPNGLFIVSRNNPLKQKVSVVERVSEDDPRVISETTSYYEYSYEYYKNSLYPRKLKTTVNGKPNANELIFTYEKCH